MARNSSWIPVQKKIVDHVKVIQISLATNRSQHEVVGILVELWIWVDSFCKSGVFPNLDLRCLARLIPETDISFWEAVQDAGWIEESEVGLVIPNFESWFRQSSESNQLPLSPGFVYIFRCENGHCKVGRSKNPCQRHASIDIGPLPVHFLHEIATDDDIWLERELHERFAHCRVRGEWFALTESELQELMLLNRINRH